MSQPTLITKTFYIDSGRKNAMYTLRSRQIGGQVYIDTYICNLANNAERAEAKAKEYFENFVARVGESENFKINYAGGADFELFERRGKLGVRETEQLEMLESGIMPFGKHVNKEIKSLPMNTIMWFVDQIKAEKTTSSVVFAAVCDYCAGVALEMGYIKARETQRAAIQADKEARALRSEFVGEKGERLVFNCHVVAAIFMGTTQITAYSYVDRYCTVMLDANDQQIVYFGTKTLGEKGDVIRFKATVKDHTIRDNIKQTIIQRPSLY